jgi:hypothetical protein
VIHPIVLGYTYLGIHHLTFLDGLIVATIDGVKKTRFGHMYGEDPKPAMPMRVWGEAGIVKVAGKVKSKLTMRGEMGMFVGYVESGSSDMYRMYLPNLNSIHETRDVQWSKRMYFAPERENSIHAVDSVVLMMNNQGVPLRTVSGMSHQIQAQDEAPHQAKGPVIFDQRVEFVSDGDEFEGADEGWTIKEIWNAPKEIEVDQTRDDEWSEVSGSGSQKEQTLGRLNEDQAGKPNESRMGPSSNYYEILRQEEEEGNDEEEDSEDDEEANEEIDNEDEEKVSSSFNPTYSDVDSRKYSAGSEGSLYEDDEAFFERLAEMTRVLDVEPPNYERSDITKHDDCDRVASEDEAGPRRSGRAI